MFSRLQRKRVILLGALCLSLTSFALPNPSVIAAPVAESESRVLCVNVEGGATGTPCANAEAYTSIQAAVDAAQNGDEIRIAQGVYTESAPTRVGDTNVVSIDGTALTLTGGFTSDNWTTPDTANATIIDGQDRRRGIKIMNAKVSMAHLSVMYGITYRDDPNGAGIHVTTQGQTLSLQDVVLSENLAYSGGGLSALHTTMHMTDTQIINNMADTGGGVLLDRSSMSMHNSHVSYNRAFDDPWGGGGIFGLSEPGAVTLSHSFVTHNQAKNGGGLYVRDLRAHNSVIAHNTAEEHVGGALADTVVLDRTRIEHNTAKTGVAGGLEFSHGTITNSVIANNTAGTYGGGLNGYLSDEINVVGTVFANNRAGSGGAAVHIENEGSKSPSFNLRNVTITSAERAPHAAVHIEGQTTTLSLTNTAITNHAVGVARVAGSTLVGDYNAFYNNGVDQTVNGVTEPLPFDHLVTTDPKFVNPAKDDVHLQKQSPLIDAGDPDRNYADQHDIDGEPVPFGLRADIGADEIQGAYRAFAPQVAR